MEALERALVSLEGLSVGDALGEQFFGVPGDVVRAIEARKLPEGPCKYTDDTEMALCIYDELKAKKEIDPDRLARRFADAFSIERGYGSGARELLLEIKRGGRWFDLAPQMFGGQGSYGNGAAMRVAPLGVYFADDFDRLHKNARLSAGVTHSHPEGIAGAIAVAVAAALAFDGGDSRDGHKFLRLVMRETPRGETKRRLEIVADIPFDHHPREVADAVGSGQNVSAPDTVPFALWCAARHMGRFEDTFWNTVVALGDRDTTCAIACGVVAPACEELPASWVALREPIFPPKLVGPVQDADV